MVHYNAAMGISAVKTISIVTPCYNEAAGIGAYLDAVLGVAGRLPDYQFEFLFIDDGSEDDTCVALQARAAEDRRVKIVALSRNFGHQRAIVAGLDYCAGDFIIVADADMQDPPELFSAIIAELERGADVVHMVRSDRSVDSWPKRATAAAFYAFMRRWVLPELRPNSGDFKGFNRRALQALLLYRENVRFLRGLFATLGFRQTEIPYVRAARHSGASKYPLTSVLRLARDAIVSNTVLPLRAGLYLGGISIAAACLYAAGCVAAFLAGNRFESPALMVLIGLVLFFSGAMLAMLGFIGEYLKCIVLETKQRPLYIVRALYNLPGTGDA